MTDSKLPDDVAPISDEPPWDDDRAQAGNRSEADGSADGENPGSPDDDAVEQ